MGTSAEVPGNIGAEASKLGANVKPPLRASGDRTTDTGSVPLFVTVTDFESLVVPAGVLGKVTSRGLAVTFFFLRRRRLLRASAGLWNNIVRPVPARSAAPASLIARARVMVSSVSAADSSSRELSSSSQRG